MDSVGTRNGNIRALNLIVEEIIADGVARDEELAYLDHVRQLLGLTPNDIESNNAWALSDAIFVHQASTGKLPALAPQQSPMALRPGEVLHLAVGVHSYGTIRVGSTTAYGGSFCSIPSRERGFLWFERGPRQQQTRPPNGHG